MFNFIENIFNRIKIDEEFKKKDFISLKSNAFIFLNSVFFVSEVYLVSVVKQKYNLT